MNTHEPAVAVRRANLIFDRPHTSEEMESLLQKGNKALKLMDDQLDKTPFLVGSDFTIADISLFAYTHVADQGGYDLSLFPNVQGWIKRIQDMPDYCDMDILDLKSI
jgi:glutathione S-transferase